jgi:hypothetical protein
MAASATPKHDHPIHRAPVQVVVLTARRAGEFVGHPTRLPMEAIRELLDRRVPVRRPRLSELNGFVSHWGPSEPAGYSSMGTRSASQAARIGHRPPPRCLAGRASRCIDRQAFGSGHQCGGVAGRLSTSGRSRRLPGQLLCRSLRSAVACAGSLINGGRGVISHTVVVGGGRAEQR